LFQAEGQTDVTKLIHVCASRNFVNAPDESLYINNQLRVGLVIVLNCLG
jgi:hypothetical protein